MRLNIDWTAPWVSGPPFKSWAFHWLWSPHGIIRGKWSVLVRVLGLNIMLTRDALWSGISVSLHLLAEQKERK